MESESDIFADKSKKDQSFQETLTTIHKFLSQENKIELIKYVKEIHNADLAEIIQNLDDDNRSKFILCIKDSFDPEILTYLNDSLRDDVIEKIDIKKKYNIDSFILFLGRFNKVKGIDVLINAINLIKNNSEFKKTQLLIMGVDFGYEEEMLQLIGEYNLQDKIKVIKNPSRKEVISAYNESEFLVLDRKSVV